MKSKINSGQAYLAENPMDACVWAPERWEILWGKDSISSMVWNKILCMWQFFKVEGGKKVTQAWAAKWPSDHWNFLRTEIWSSWWPWHCILTQGTSWALSLQHNYRLSSLDLTLSYGRYNWPLLLAQLPLPELPLLPAHWGRTSRKAVWEGAS